MALAALALLAGCGQSLDSATPVASSTYMVVPQDDVSVAARQAAATKKSVELKKRRTKSSRTYIQPNGTTLVVTTDANGRKTRKVRNTPPSVNSDQGQGPGTCTDGSGPSVNSTTPTLRVSAADVDAKVHKAKVRVLFEVWPVDANDGTPYSKLKARDALVSGKSAWVAPNTLATWKVPAGKLAVGETYIWRARADDGVTVSPYTSWYWQLFNVDPSRGVSKAKCGDYGMDPGAVNAINGVLGDLVEERDDLYADWEPAWDFGPKLFVRPQRGSTDKAAIAKARSLAERRIWAYKDAEVTDQHRREIIAAMTVRMARK